MKTQTEERVLFLFYLVSCFVVSRTCFVYVFVFVCFCFCFVLVFFCCVRGCVGVGVFYNKEHAMQVFAYFHPAFSACRAQ